MTVPDRFNDTLREWIEAFMRRSMRNFIRYSRENGLSMSQIGALFQIQRGEGGVTDLGDELGVSSAAASQMLERLLQQELILRTEDPHDRRAKHLVLTDKGRQILQETIHARQGWLTELADTLSDGEKEQIIAALNVLIDKTINLEKNAEQLLS
jgi:DNA-binding MarR family transcriptional regulator